MYQIKEYLEKMLAEFDKRQYAANKELQSLPEGTLSRVMRKGKATYFQVTVQENLRKRKSINKKPQMIQKLARKKYLQEEILILERDFALIEKFLKYYENPESEEIIKKLPSDYRELIFLPVCELGWGSQPYQQSAYKPEKRIHTTSRGLKVRSKSELLIAEKLYEHGIPFRYEQILWYGTTEFAPDFTIRTADGRIIYWEHCGMTHDERYINHHKWKMSIYEKMGIVPWKNLIVTYDDESGIISIPLIESEIVNKLK